MIIIIIIITFPLLLQLLWKLDSIVCVLCWIRSLYSSLAIVPCQIIINFDWIWSWTLLHMLIILFRLFIIIYDGIVSRNIPERRISTHFFKILWQWLIWRLSCISIVFTSFSSLFDGGMRATVIVVTILFIIVVTREIKNRIVGFKAKSHSGWINWIRK